FVAFPFLLLLVSSIDGLVLIPTDTSWLSYSKFMVTNPVNTFAFRHSIRSSPSFGMANVGNLPNFLLILQKASLALFVQTGPLLSPFLVGPQVGGASAPQIKIVEEDEEKTGFHTEEGIYCFTHMPKELKNSAATLQRMMEKVLTNQGGRNAEIY
nr:hypothetical protein [Tanacetum cinerariifolium]